MPDIVTARVFVDGEKGITATKMNQIISQSVIQPSFMSSKPASSTLDPTDQILDLKGGTGTYATITGQQLIDSVANSSNIALVRLRSWNAAGNPSFEIDQRNAGTLISGASTQFLADRWKISKTGAMVVSIQQLAGAAGEVAIPGINTLISSYYGRVKITTAQASLGASDNLLLFQAVEGSSLRQLFGDVHSISLLVRSSSAGLKFGVNLLDPSGTRTLTKLCTLGAANTWQIITLPNIPVFAAGGSWSGFPGTVGYYLQIVLAAGTTVTSSANDVWLNAGTYGAVGQSNFAATLNATFDIAFIQHEPGSSCSTFMDKPFIQNLDECRRYYQKNLDYGTVVGGVTPSTYLYFYVGPTSRALATGSAIFQEPMAKVPTMTIYNYSTGAANSLRVTGSNFTVSSVGAVGTKGFAEINTSTSMTVNGEAIVIYSADTLW